jgi:methylated-DNA-[protein]-cysteine S-methyltransferase
MLRHDGEDAAPARFRGPGTRPPGGCGGIGPLPLRSRRARLFRGRARRPGRASRPVDGTDFEVTVWHTLRRIPAGSTWSYGILAASIERPKAVRAVGAANGRNPISLVLPCHRVIGADGSLTGYGGGLERKAWLLRHEGALCV